MRIRTSCRADIASARWSAITLSCRPNLLLADEPTTALNAIVQIQMPIILRELQKELGMGMIFVTHDLGIAPQVADKMAVMYAGRIVEYGSARDVLINPMHPYTRGMLASTVHPNMRDVDIEAILEVPPDLRHMPPGCSFTPSCEYAESACLAAAPVPVTLG
jgi:peptide/nickel transport system ATP-binding protein